MSINKTLIASAVALALAACSSDEKAQSANAPAAAQPSASAANTASGTAATADAAAQAANAANIAATAPATDAASASNSATMAGNASADATGKAADAIQSQDLNTPGFTADIMEAKRSDGVLSIKMRLRNTGAKAAEVKIYAHAKTEAFYVQAEGKKYLVLTDTEQAALATPADSYDGTLSPSIAPGASYTWWAKYPAPPADIKKFSFYWPLGAPFDDVPITDK